MITKEKKNICKAKWIASRLNIEPFRYRHYFSLIMFSTPRFVRYLFFVLVNEISHLLVSVTFEWCTPHSPLYRMKVEKLRLCFTLRLFKWCASFASTNAQAFSVLQSSERRIRPQRRRRRRKKATTVRKRQNVWQRCRLSFIHLIGKWWYANEWMEWLLYSAVELNVATWFDRCARWRMKIKNHQKSEWHKMTLCSR